MRVSISASFSCHFLSLDWWSGPYVGAHWIACKELPEDNYSNHPHHDSMAQLLLIASHHLVELIIFQCISEHLENNPEKAIIYGEKIKDLSFYKALTQYPQNLGYPAFDMEVEPFKSIESLRLRRNATIHKDSKLATNKMARSEFYSAVQGCIEICNHFRGENGFPYRNVLNKYPIPKCDWFSEINKIERFSENRSFPRTL